ncbi:hypothetical protein BDP55DRAFT_630879 [Colletotrichum godetiae]|uniref:Uncharacterized protein n=1 Tax=Colletotrichum godetiae TaxID=1209918 RepID=A0AAJ0EU12_9PEZI|nr:uncharacterized protein BDP55DRAFT_630879 [Colletotrichum godetiae]KAK1676791.1 hypothetical protein BDP55DRAFT_630879 [Colletotrichum godetiae]
MTPTPLAEAHFQDCLDSQESSRAPTPTSSETPSLGEAFDSLEESSTRVIVSGDKALGSDDETFSPPALATVLTMFYLWCVFEFWESFSQKVLPSHWSETVFIVATMVALASMFTQLDTWTGLGCVAYTTLHICLRRHCFWVMGKWKLFVWDLKAIYFLNEIDHIALQILIMTCIVAWLGPETYWVALKRYLPAWTKKLLSQLIAKNL